MYKNPQSTYKTVQEILLQTNKYLRILPELFRILNENSIVDWMHRASDKTFNIFHYFIARHIISLTSLSISRSKFGREIMLINT